MKINKIFSILQFTPIPNPAGTGGETSNGKTGSPGKSSIGMYALAAIALLTVVVIVLYAGQPAAINQKSSNENPKATPTPIPTETKAVTALGAGIGAATSSQNGQETTNANTDWIKKLETDKSDPVLGRTIQRTITSNDKVLIPTNPIPKEVRLFRPELNVYLIDLKIDDKGILTGEIDNRGSKTVKIAPWMNFKVIRDDYEAKSISALIIYKGQVYPFSSDMMYISPGQKIGFKTVTTQLSQEEILSIKLISPPNVIDGSNNRYGK